MRATLCNGLEAVQHDAQAWERGSLASVASSAHNLLHDLGRKSLFFCISVSSPPLCLVCLVYKVFGEGRARLQLRQCPVLWGPALCWGVQAVLPCRCIHKGEQRNCDLLGKGHRPDPEQRIRVSEDLLVSDLTVAQPGGTS